MEEMKDTDELKFDQTEMQLWTNLSVLLSKYSFVIRTYLSCCPATTDTRSFHLGQIDPKLFSSITQDFVYNFEMFWVCEEPQSRKCIYAKSKACFQMCRY